ncbi:hypothetical protein PoB_001835000 [Plakobranchus ocellatus]|uniref:Uncharacterized protein n=1 Tax=Plakobranchus ocellatus TaxID=259542 RepID=A0AAV3Z9M1_9GAST|nr:hypothetical protein PoB_001835000 [Plakobranchus ocellatus]
MISGFQTLRHVRAPVTGLEPATEGSLWILGRAALTGKLTADTIDRTPEDDPVYNWKFRKEEQTSHRLLDDLAWSGWMIWPGLTSQILYNSGPVMSLT